MPPPRKKTGPALLRLIADLAPGKKIPRSYTEIHRNVAIAGLQARKLD